MADFETIAIALSGIAQAARLTQSLATTGNCDSDALSCSVDSLLRVNAPTALDVFGGNLHGLQIGIQELCCQLSYDSNAKAPDVTRYMMSLINLERQLNKNAKIGQLLSNRIQQVVSKREFTGEEGFSNHYADFADIYISSIATLKPRIKVAGKPTFLEQNHIQEKVRTVLLAGIRATVLWRQVGGKRRQLILNRKQLLNASLTLKRKL